MNQITIDLLTYMCIFLYAFHSIVFMTHIFPHSLRFVRNVSEHNVLHDYCYFQKKILKVKVDHKKKFNESICSYPHPKNSQVFMFS